MKRILFWILLIAGLIVSVRIGNILIFYFHRLTEFGWGYLTGLVILFILIAAFTAYLGIKTYGRDRNS
jgi:hypothetical protein